MNIYCGKQLLNSAFVSSEELWRSQRVLSDTQINNNYIIIIIIIIIIIVSRFFVHFFAVVARLRPR